MSAQDDYVATLRGQMRRLRDDRPTVLAEYADAVDELTTGWVGQLEAAGLGSLPATAFIDAPGQIRHRPGCPGIGDRDVRETDMADGVLIVRCRRCEARVLVLADGSRVEDPFDDERQRGWLDEATRRKGPAPMTTAEQVEATRRQLVDDDLPAGERSIARRLGTSRDAVRYALGKDR